MRGIAEFTGFYKNSFHMGTSVQFLLVLSCISNSYCYKIFEPFVVATDILVFYQVVAYLFVFISYLVFENLELKIRGTLYFSPKVYRVRLFL